MTFGSEDTNLSVNPCWPFGTCMIVTTIPNPLTYAFLGLANGVLAGEGSCWGIAVTSRQLTSGRVPYSRFGPAGASSPWQLDSATAPGQALRTHIRRWHVVQLSSEFIQEYTSQRLANPALGTATIRARIRDELSAGRPPLVILADGLGGHVVVAHDIRIKGDGSYEVDVYDPNIPYLEGEQDNDPNHEDRMSRSTIFVSSSGNWTHRGTYASQWSGGLSSMLVVPFSRIPTNPSLPISIHGLRSLILPFADGGTQTVTDSQGRTLTVDSADAGTTTIPGATVVPTISGDDARPIYVVPASAGALTYAVTNERTRSYGHAVAGPGFAATIQGINGTVRTTDRIGLDARAGQVWVDPAAAVGSMTIDMARAGAGANGGERTARLRFTGAGSGRITASLGNTAGAGLSVTTTGGAATVHVDLGWAGAAGVPASVPLPAVRLASGHRLQVAPTSWNRLHGTAISLQVRNSAGRVVSRRTVRTPAPRYLRAVSGSLTTRRANDRQLTVLATPVAARLPAGTRLAQVAEVRRGNRLVRRVSRTVTWRGGRQVAWRVPIALPAGTYDVRVASTVVVSTGGKVNTHSLSRRFATRLR